eukprot:g1724.t1
MDELCDRLASALKITDVKRLNDIKALLYADDVALIAHSRTELQKMVNVVAKFAEDYRLEVNLKPGKTEIMPIYTSSKAKRPSIRERGEIQARYRLMCWNQLVGAKLKYAFDVWHVPADIGFDPCSDDWNVAAGTGIGGIENETVENCMAEVGDWGKGKVQDEIRCLEHPSAEKIFIGDNPHLQWFLTTHQTTGFKALH